MRPSWGMLLMGLPVCIVAYNPFRAVPQAATSSSDIHSSSPTGIPGGLNPSDLLHMGSRKPDIFNKAIAELKRLESKPMCHRIAARLLVNNCRGLEELNEHNFQFDSSEAQRHHVDSFTISLTACELERMALDVPRECSPFMSAALFQYAREGREKIEVSVTQVNECLRALAQDQSSLQTWISYRDKAIIFCQAARLDLDKDEAVRLNRKLAEIMEEFINDATGHLESMKKNMANNAQVSNDFFESVMKDTNSWNSKVLESFKSVTDGAKDIDIVMRSILNNSNNVTQMMKSFMKMVFEGTASIANEHEKTLDVTTNKFEARVASVYDMVAETEGKLSEVKELVVGVVGPMIALLLERQNNLENKTQIVLSAVINATELLQTHNQKLDQATSKASIIATDLERVAATVKGWGENLNMNGSAPDWAVRSISLLTPMAVGNIGVPSTWTRNIRLVAAGYVAGESIVLIRNIMTTVQVLPHMPKCFLWASIMYQQTPANTHLAQSSPEYLEASDPRERFITDMT